MSDADKLFEELGYEKTKKINIMNNIKILILAKLFILIYQIN